MYLIRFFVVSNTGFCLFCVLDIILQMLYTCKTRLCSSLNFVTGSIFIWNVFTCTTCYYMFFLPHPEKQMVYIFCLFLDLVSHAKTMNSKLCILETVKSRTKTNHQFRKLVIKLHVVMHLAVFNILWTLVKIEYICTTDWCEFMI